jgi:IclR family transcriptional regulator, KDG regulon repressor
MEKMLGRVFAVLENVAASETPRGVNELARELKLPPSNVHRILRALMSLHYVAQDNRSTYSITPRLFEIGMAAGGRIDIKVLAHPVLEDIGTQTKEAVGLTTLEGEDIVYLDNIESPHPVRAFARVGNRISAFNSAAGRAILAFRPDGEGLLRGMKRKASTARTVTNADELVRQLTIVRKQGFAIVREERVDRVSAVAAPILNRENVAVAAISLYGPSERLRPTVLREYAAVIVDAAARISERLRGNAPLKRPV